MQAKLRSCQAELLEKEQELTQAKRLISSYEESRKMDEYQVAQVLHLLYII
jgi:hypothetical protein